MCWSCLVPRWVGIQDRLIWWLQRAAAATRSWGVEVLSVVVDPTYFSQLTISTILQKKSDGWASLLFLLLLCLLGAVLPRKLHKKKTWAAKVMQNSPLSEWILGGGGSQDFLKNFWEVNIQQHQPHHNRCRKKRLNK